jgi:hypothetical protein
MSFFLSLLLGWSGTESTITEASVGLFYQFRITMDDEYGAVGGMIGRENPSIRGKPATVSICPA